MGELVADALTVTPAGPIAVDFDEVAARSVEVSEVVELLVVLVVVRELVDVVEEVEELASDCSASC